MFDGTLLQRASSLLALCEARGQKIATAESCTGGLIAGCLTEIAGSSAVVDRGFVTYTNEAKVSMLGVLPSSLQAVGAVSERVAREMAEGALKASLADLSIAVTGIAGPGGATAEKPVGLVYLAVARRGRATEHKRFVFKGDRSAVRQATVAEALVMLKQASDGLSASA